jgi:predicted glycosyltransferase
MQSFTDDMVACMDAADLVICMGGYNTVCELLTLGKRAIVVPRVMPVQEQWIRAERMAELGLLRAIHPDAVSPELLMTALAEELAKGDSDSGYRYPINLNGLSGVRDALASLMDGLPETNFIPLKQGLLNRVQQKKTSGDFSLRVGQ